MLLFGNERIVDGFHVWRIFSDCLGIMQILLGCLFVCSLAAVVDWTGPDLLTQEVGVFSGERLVLVSTVFTNIAAAHV